MSNTGCDFNHPEFVVALKELERACWEVIKRWPNETEMTDPDVLSKTYPFSHSFDELCHEVSAWVETIQKSAEFNDLELNDQIVVELKKLRPLWGVWHDYPGVINVHLNDGSFRNYTFGTANGPWEGDAYLEHSYLEKKPALNANVDGKCRDAVKISRGIIEAIGDDIKAPQLTATPQLLK